jgi:tetratricopeptide (TPR) repeat protein
MKKVNIFIVVGVVALCLAGWFALATQKVSQSSAYNEYIAQADEWVSMGLYQRAIQNYESAIEEAPTEELYVKTMDAYQLRYEEAAEDTKKDYIAFLKEATNAYPANKQLVDQLVAFYTAESKYASIYACLQRAVDNGYDDDDVQAKLLAAKYAFELRRSEFSGIRQSVGDIFSTTKEQAWNLYNLSDGYIFSSDYHFVGLCSADGTVVVTGEDSRIVTTDGMVLGIFDGLVTDAGIYAEGLVPACMDETYSYYNDFAEKQFGEYEMASMFQNGSAAVKSDGKWMLVNTKGEVISDSYEEIVLDYAGRYFVDGLILAKTSDETYGLYDEKWNLKAEIECSDTDIDTSDGLIAICQNGKWGYANTSGEMVIEPTYDEAKSFSNGVAAVRAGDLWGFINKENQLVIDYQFTDVGYMDANGICPVRTDEPNEVTESSESDVQTNEESETWKFLELVIGIEEE